MIIAKSLTKAYESTQKEIDLTDYTKIILFCDLHRGVGDWSDDFALTDRFFRMHCNIILTRVIPILKSVMEMNCGKTKTSRKSKGPIRISLN